MNIDPYVALNIGAVLMIFFSVLLAIAIGVGLIQAARLLWRNRDWLWARPACSQKNNRVRVLTPATAADDVIGEQLWD